MFKRLISALFAVVVGATLTTGDAAAQGQAPAIEQIRQRGTLRVGVSTFVPWAMRDTGGTLIGFEIDVARKIAQDLGVQLEHIPTAWDGIIPALIAGRFDVIISGMSVTPQRQQTVDFTIPYANSGQEIVANRNLSPNLRTLQDLNAANVTVACRRGVVACTFLSENLPRATVRQFDDDAQAAQEVLNGRANAWMASFPRPRFLALDNPQVAYMPFQDFVTRAEEAIAVRKGDTATIERLNTWIRDNQAFLAERHAFWFNSREWRNRVPTN
ncbi:MAG: transporter substrate-binding domain-containing protein [Alphaproteobacteria bacterium]|nr:transporter substrate-binding domain-containing protein [Alphaproteobacteria bacterium]